MPKPSRSAAVLLSGAPPRLHAGCPASIARSRPIRRSSRHTSAIRAALPSNQTTTWEPQQPEAEEEQKTWEEHRGYRQVLGGADHLLSQASGVEEELCVPTLPIPPTQPGPWWLCALCSTRLHSNRSARATHEATVIEQH